MKFAKSFEESLVREGYPESWVKSAVPYAQLKKYIRKVQEELNSIGLDSKTLGYLIPPTGQDGAPRKSARRGSIPVAFKYEIPADANAYNPRLTLLIQLEDGVPVDAELSPDTRSFLKDIAMKLRIASSIEDSDDDVSNDPSLTNRPAKSVIEDVTSTKGDDGASDLMMRRVEVPLTFDSEFFGLLQGELSTLEALQAKEQKALHDDITSLSKIIADVVTPSKFKQKDLNQWRVLFDLYLQAGVFFSTKEIDSGKRNSATAVQRLEWFQVEAKKRVKPFKMPASTDALRKFLNINLTLLQNVKFQEINQRAITKILKKFDKHTSLGAHEIFPKLSKSRIALADDMAKAVCAGISNEVLKTVPRLNDYLCPVCIALAYHPVKLSCGHVFCIRCMVTMQNNNRMACPLCRQRVVMAADASNCDDELEKHMKKWFPKERRQKEKDNEEERRIEERVLKFGERHRDDKGCVVM